MKEIWIQAIAVAGYSVTATIAFILKIFKIEQGLYRSFRYGEKRGK